MEKVKWTASKLEKGKNGKNVRWKKLKKKERKLDGKFKKKERK